MNACDVRLLSADAFVWRSTAASNQTGDDPLAAQVAAILAAVRRDGDAAIGRFTAAFDGVAQAADQNWTMRVAPELAEQAWLRLDSALQAAIDRAAARIKSFHEAQRPADIHLSDADGAQLGMVWRPIARVGVYAPGGQAAYPSTVLMNVIPAQVAGVQEIALASPPQRESALPHPLVLAVAHRLGVTEIYRIGGAQAIAAFAYGTASVPAVDKVVGPGNAYVAMAKRSVMGDVGIDSIAGPSEVFIIADESASAVQVAADLLAQAEHDADAGAVLLTTSDHLAAAVQQELASQLSALPRRDVAAAALRQNGAIVRVRSLAEAVAVVNRCAPEHVEILTLHPRGELEAIQRAGAVFLGPHSPVPVGDYYAGPNHVLPTHGNARYASGLGVADFLRRMTTVEYSAATLQQHAADIERLAIAEGLDGHARAVAVRGVVAVRGEEQRQ